MFGRTRRHEFQSRGRLLNDPACEGRAILQFDFGGVVSVPDNFVRINDVVKQRVECAATHAGQVRPDVRAFAVHFVADKTIALGHLVTRLGVVFTCEHQLTFRCDELQFVIARGAVFAEKFVCVVADGGVLAAGQSASGGGGNVLRAGGFLFHGGQQGATPFAAEHEDFRRNASGRQAEIRPGAGHDIGDVIATENGESLNGGGIEALLIVRSRPPWTRGAVGSVSSLAPRRGEGRGEGCLQQFQ